jgi:hypothetical protein
VDWQEDDPLSDVMNDIADDGEWLEQEYNRNCSITLSRNMWLASQFWLHYSRLTFDETGHQLILSLVYFLLQATPHSELDLASDVDFVAGRAHAMSSLVVSYQSLHFLAFIAHFCFSLLNIQWVFKCSNSLHISH